jgi:hypothetical protein
MAFKLDLVLIVRSDIIVAGRPRAVFTSVNRPAVLSRWRTEYADESIGFHHLGSMADVS